MTKQFHVFSFDRDSEVEIVEELVFSGNTKKEAEQFIQKDASYGISYQIHEGILVDNEEGGWNIE